ncbi:MAG: xylulokinase [Myxococcota bacterium]
MTAGPFYLGFDVGTQGTKGVCLDAGTGAVVARAGRRYGLIEGLGPGAAEQHPDTWIDAVRAVAGELLVADGVDPARVRGVGVSGQQHGLVVVDGAGEVVRPAKLWCDTTTAEEARELTRVAGRAVPTGFTAPKALWLVRREPSQWRRVRRIMLPHDYVNFRLTGEPTTDPGDASGTGWFDPESRRYDASILRHIDPGLEPMLPRVVAPGEPAGRVTAEGARRTGVPEGTLVAAGSGDNMMSAIGSGATRDGVVVVSLGTSGTAFAHSSRPLRDPEGLIAPFCDATGGWLPLLCVMNMTGVLEEVRRAFAGEDHESLTALAEEVAPGADGLLLLPYLVGERVPDMPSATGALLGLRPGLLRPGHLYRAAMEGTSLSLASGVARMRRLGLASSEVRLVGGGSDNRLWRQVLADVLEVPIVRLAEPESAALGAAIQARWTDLRDRGEEAVLDAVAAPLLRTGEATHPDPAAFAVYREARGRLEELTRRLFDS